MIQETKILYSQITRLRQLLVQLEELLNAEQHALQELSPADSLIALIDQKKQLSNEIESSFSAILTISFISIAGSELTFIGEANQPSESLQELHQHIHDHWKDIVLKVKTCEQLNHDNTVITHQLIHTNRASIQLLQTLSGCQATANIYDKNGVTSSADYRRLNTIEA